MPYCTCASDCGVCTTSLRSERGRTYETEMVLDYSRGNYRDSAVSVHRRRGHHASVELVAAAAVRLESANLLAGTRITRTVSDSFRWTGTPWRTGPETSLGRPLQKDDTGGTGKIPARNARRFRLWRICEPERRKLDDLIGCHPEGETA